MSDFDRPEWLLRVLDLLPEPLRLPALVLLFEDMAWQRVCQLFKVLCLTTAGFVVCMAALWVLVPGSHGWFQWILSAIGVSGTSLGFIWRKRRKQRLELENPDGVPKRTRKGRRKGE